MSKKCPLCGMSYPADHVFCVKDGTRLKNRGSSYRNKAIITIFVLILLVLVGVNLLPVYIKHASRNFDIELLGLEIDPPRELIENPVGMAYQAWQQTLDGIVGMLSGRGTGMIDIPINYRMKVTLHLKLQNNNFFSIDLNKLKYSLYLGQYELGSSDISPSQFPLRLESRKPVKFDLVTSVSLSKILVKSLATLISRDFSYRLAGSAELDSFIGKRTVNFDLHRKSLPF